MTIYHSKCDHESTSSARAKCRRGNSDKGASIKTIDFKGSGAKKASTPRDRDKQCDICGVERIAYRGTDPLSRSLIYVGDKCAYYLNNAPDKVEVD
jgi:hypothetical protein